MSEKWNIGEGGDMPIGFGLSLAANAKSMEAFAKMSDDVRKLLYRNVPKCTKAYQRKPFFYDIRIVF